MRCFVFFVVAQYGAHVRACASTPRGIATLRFAACEGRLVAAYAGWGWPAKRQHFVSCFGAARDLDHEGSEEGRGRDDGSNRDKSDGVGTSCLNPNAASKIRQ